MRRLCLGFGSFLNHMQLRAYQQRAIDELYAWFKANAQGNPCLVLPTGSGKSHIIAALCKDAVQSFPETRILMLTHVKELIVQNAEKMREHWRDAPLGVYSAGLNTRCLYEQITFAGIQSVRNKAAQIGFIDLCIIDEAHTVSHHDAGGYRKLINDLTSINPALRVIGLTASPYRLGHGYITDKPALFDALIEPVSIEELVRDGYLAPLRSKHTSLVLSTAGVHKRGGEFIAAELQSAVNKKMLNEEVVRETIARAEDRKAWLFFCSGVDHAENICAILQDNGISAACVTGDTPIAERDKILSDFKSGKIRAITNMNVLSTGFDYPDIDLIAMLRPTMSAGLYVQMTGRGMRPKSHTDHCLILDFAGVVQQHGPITAVQPQKRKGSGDGEAPVKVCDACNELCHISAKVCPACDTPFPVPPPRKYELHGDDIMGIEGTDLIVTAWNWRKHVSHTSGRNLLAVSYYGGLSDMPITEYFPVGYPGYAGDKAINNVLAIAQKGGLFDGGLNVCTIDEMAHNLNQARAPAIIEYKKDGKYNRVIRREWA